MLTIFESSNEFLRKVKISGGGRCNVTHSCYDPKVSKEITPWEKKR